MADQTTSYVIQITDGIEPAIERRLTAITTGALRAAQSCVELQSAINKLNGSGITAVSTALRDSGTAQRSLTTSTQAYARNAASAVTATNNFAAALPKLDAAVIATTNNLRAMMAQLTGFSTAARAAANAANPAAQSLSGVGSGANGAAFGVRNMNAVLGVARGNITSANRLAGSFLSTLIGAGPIVAAAFSVLGALALIAVLAEMVQAIGHVVDAYKSMQKASAEARIQAIDDGNKIIKVHADLFTAVNAARVFSGRGADRSEITVQQVAPLEQQATAIRQVTAAQNELNEAGLKGAALQAQKRKDAATDFISLTQQRDAMQQVREQLSAQATAQTISLKTEPIFGVPIGIQSTNTVTDPKQTAEIDKNYTAATEAVKRLNVEIVTTALNMRAAGKRELVAGVTDELKAARQEMVALEKGYKDYVTTLGHKITPNETLAYWQNAEAGLKHYATNIDAVNGKEAPPLQAIASRNDNLDRTNENLDDQISSIGAYSDALKEKQQLDKLTLEYQKTGIPLTQEETNVLRGKIQVITTLAQYQSELNAQYIAAVGPVRTYLAAQQAISKLIQDDPGNATKYTQQLNQATIAYNNAINPMEQYSHELQNQMQLLGQFGTSLEVATQLQQVTEGLRAKGITDPAQVQQLTAAYKAQLTTLVQLKGAYAALDTVIGQTSNEKLVQQQMALNAAYEAGAISQEKFRSAAIQVAAAQAEIQNGKGLTTWASSTTQILGQLTKGYTTFADGATKAFGNFFTTLEDGFANNIAHAIVFGGSIKKALEATAKTAVEGLLAALIKLGIQWIITNTIGQALQAATAATTIAMASDIGAAWAPAAALASLATVGTNAVAADAAMATSVVFADSLAALHFAEGGPVPGVGSTDSVRARLTPGEFVVRASSYAAHPGLVQAINNGAPIVYNTANTGYASYGVSNSGTNGMRVEVHNYAGVAVSTQQLTDSHVRIMIQQEVPGLVAKHAPVAVASDIANPNGRVSKSLAQNVTSERIR